MVFSQRRDQLRKKCSSKKVEGFLTFDSYDVSYLSGFPTEGCFVLVSCSGDFIFAPLLLGEHAKSFLREDSGLSVIYQGPLLKELENILKNHKLKKIGFDPTKMTLSLFKELSRFRQVRLFPLDPLVLSQRMIKDECEIEKISRACQIAVKSCRACFENLQEGQSEEEIARHLQNLFHKNGSSKPAFESIVAFGERSAFPHHVVSDKRLEKNSVVLMDLGSVIDGYRSDLTRTGFFGKIPSKFHKIYRIVKKAQQEGIEAVRGGVSAGKIDFICREVIRKSGYGDYFIHGTGHGVGLEIHEPPRLGKQSKEILREGMVVTVEPGIYLPGEFGVRIEDTLLVTKGGCRILTKGGNRDGSKN